MVMLYISLIILTLMTALFICLLASFSLSIAIPYRIYHEYKKYYNYDRSTGIISVESLKYFYELGKRCGGKKHEDIPDQIVRMNHSNTKLVYYSFYSGVRDSNKMGNKLLKKYYEFLQSKIIDNDDNAIVVDI